MKAVIRLDGDGNPYLICYYEDKEGGGDDANDDAERLFFNKLNQNGGLLHLVPGRDKSLKMIVTTGLVKRKANVTETNILGNPEPRASAAGLSVSLTPKNHEPMIKEEKSNKEDLSPKAETKDSYVPDFVMGKDEDPLSIGPS
jgi:hypothetical protein